MLSKDIVINGKTFKVNEKRNKEIKQLIDKYSAELSKIQVGSNVGGIFSGINSFIEGKLIELIPGVKAIDLEEAYPSEVDAAIDAIVTLNFPLARRFGGPLMTLISLSQRQK